MYYSKTQELKNRIEELVLMAYTLRRKTRNEPLVSATEQEYAHLYIDGACAKKYYKSRAITSVRYKPA